MKLVLISAFLCLTIGAAANAQNQNCNDRVRVLQLLAEKYGETRQAIGLGTQGRVMEVFASLETGTWTITITLPGGVTCLLASGEAYESLTEELEPAGIDG